MNRDEAILRIRAALKLRSAKAWSVTGGSGTAYGWIDVQAPPRRRLDGAYTNPEDCAELGRLFGLPAPAHFQGLSISPDDRLELVRAVEAKKVEVSESFLVRRVGPALERKDYGPFGGREEAEFVAQRSAEKHVGASVWVEPSGVPTRAPASASFARAEELSPEVALRSAKLADVLAMARGALRVT